MTKARGSRAVAVGSVVDYTDSHAFAQGAVIVVNEVPATACLLLRRSDPDRSATTPGLRDLDLASLMGCTEADVRRRIETAGGVFRTYDDEHPALTSDLVPRRVTARVKAPVIEVYEFS